jgi:hypothetical protein
VIGHIAGRMTQTNKIGYIASFPIPEVIQGINSAFLHARKVNPEVEMVVIWAYTWFDPAKEADAAKAMIEQGVDVIMQHTDSTAPQAAAQEAGNVFTFGQASDMAQFKPTPRISSIIDNWAPYYIKRVQAALDGTWTSTHTWGGIGDGEVEIGEITEAVPADVKAEAEALRDSIAAGEYHPFTGPDQQAGRHALAGRGRGRDRRGARVDELLRRGHRGRHPELTVKAGGSDRVGPSRPHLLRRTLMRSVRFSRPLVLPRLTPGPSRLATSRPSHAAQRLRHVRQRSFVRPLPEGHGEPPKRRDTIPWAAFSDRADGALDARSRFWNAGEARSDRARP